ncbi:uncharacterized protein LOC141639297 [Silene latifolia]|uniref:uncharacterized protein LOC141639297 n=1 Tax=Silene latifolia TaxID=37657 RepID=UPI003D770D28
MEDEVGCGAVKTGTGHAKGGWEKPLVGTVKVNVDAGFVEGLGMGMGAVCWENSGKICWGVAVQREERYEVKVAEAEAVLTGLKEAHRTGYPRVIIESDNIGVVDDLKQRKQGRSDIHLVYEDIYLICNLFESVVFRYLRRYYNKVAHEIAHARPWVYDRRCWVDDLSMYVADIAYLDLIYLTLWVFIKKTE